MKLNPVFNSLDNPQTFVNHIEDLKQDAQTSEKEHKKSISFPTHIFPQAIQEIIYETNKCLNFPIDFIGSSLLYASSLAIGNSCQVQQKNTWYENAVLYMAIVGRAGTNKSHPLRFAIKPIEQQDNDTFAEYEKQRQEYEEYSTLSKSEKSQQEIPAMFPPTLKKFLVSDTTPEALTYVHYLNKRGIGVHVDELAGWFKNFDRYHKGAEEEFWLSNWNSSPIIIDRKTSSSIRITKPFISVCGTTQTAILSEMAKDNRSKNGFIDRILFVVPEGLKKEKWNDNELDACFVENWKSIINNLLQIPFQLDNNDIPQPNTLVFTPEAKQLLGEWQSKNTDLCNELENDSLIGIYTKLDVYCIRFALIFQLLKYACEEGDRMKVSLEAVQSAIELTEYFKTMNTKVYNIISETTPLDQLPENKQQFYNSLPETLTTHDAIEKGSDFGLSQRTIKRFLGDKQLFNRVKQGVYEKLY
ncbi:MAG: DUF3987 domain-containing protein [Cytophagales bacterium]|nr:DUF3987 domain-containing protein [Cytophagales bacterium]